MRIAYLDCFAGISGDMFLGSLLSAGLPPDVLHQAVAALNLNATLRIATVDRSGISSIKVDVLEDGHLADGAPNQNPTTHTRIEPPHSHEHAHQHDPEPLSPQPKTQHQHKAGHAHDHPHAHDDTHTHDHPHTHGRSLTQIRELIQLSSLATAVQQTAIHTFELLGHSEAKIHNVPVDQIHFHEVGAVDAIVDIVCAAAGIHHLNIGAWYSSPINVGGGMVQCAHGLFPIPAPATADLLRGLPTYSAHIQKELVTPTGAAILRTLNPTFSPQPPMRVDSIGYGAGSRNPPDFPNVLRLSLGESTASAPTETITVLETALDDLSPQLIAHVAEAALSAGALDVMLTPAIMKKGRPGTLLTLLCEDPRSSELQQLLFRETSTLGIRIRRDQRAILDRTHIAVTTPYGEIRIKQASLNNEEQNAAPEFEDCKRAAAQHNVSVKQVQQAAIAAYEAGK